MAGAALESHLALIAVGVLQWHSCCAGSNKQGSDATLSDQRRILCCVGSHLLVLLSSRLTLAK